MKTDLPSIPNPIIITDNAIEQIRSIMQEENLTDQYIRVVVLGGGCSGLKYSMDFTDKITDMDITYDLQGIKIAVDCFSAYHLNGTTIDYIDNLTSTGFKFHNPNAVRKCGCGASFS